MTVSNNFPELYRVIASKKVKDEAIALTKSSQLLNNATFVAFTDGEFKDCISLVNCAQHCLKTQFDWLESCGRFGIYTLGSVDQEKKWLLSNQSVLYEFVIPGHSNTSIKDLTKIFDKSREVLDVNIDLQRNSNYNQTTIKITLTPAGYFHFSTLDSVRNLLDYDSQLGVIASRPEAIYYGLKVTCKTVKIFDFLNFEAYQLATSKS
jgi:hypothetical protein